MTTEKSKGENNSTNKATITLAGTVQKIIPAMGAEPEKAQISVQGAEHLFRELRVENTFYDETGDIVSLKQGAQVELTIRAVSEARSPKRLPHSA